MRMIGMWMAIAATSGCDRQRPENAGPDTKPVPTVTDTGARASAGGGSSEGASTSGTADVRGSSATLAACAPENVFDTLTAKLVAQADANADGQLSREEVEMTANLLVGGFFFAADANGDGTVSIEEGRTARSAVLKRVPALDPLLTAARTATNRSPLATVARLLDLEYGKPLTNAEARTAAQNATQEMFAAGDRNRDGVLTQEEIRGAQVDAAQSLGRSAFAAADRDSDRQLSVDEVKEAFVQATRAVFRLSDADKNGKLSEREGASALQAIAFWYGEARGDATPAAGGFPATSSTGRSGRPENSGGTTSTRAGGTTTPGRAPAPANAGGAGAKAP